MQKVEQNQVAMNCTRAAGGRVRNVISREEPSPRCGAVQYIQTRALRFRLYCAEK